MHTCPERDLAFKAAGVLHPLPFLFRAGETLVQRFNGTERRLFERQKAKRPLYGLAIEVKCKWASCFVKPTGSRRFGGTESINYA